MFGKLTVLVAVIAALLVSGCSVSEGEGFAIYLTKGDIPPVEMEALSHIDIAEQPVISTEDIITYTAETHELRLTAGSYERISQLEVPVRGTSFVVCVDGKPIYWGAFWTLISSISFQGVTIWQPLGLEEPHTIRLRLGYPSPSFYGGEDPRDNPEVMGALERAGKLIGKLSIATIDELPHSLKGYELYSWSEDSQWHFTLITVTNRTKTPEEVTSGEDTVSEAGWVRIHVVGIGAMEAVLGKLPRNEYVLWLARVGGGQTPQGGVSIALPPGQAVDSVKERAAQCGLDFHVLTP